MRDYLDRSIDEYWDNQTRPKALKFSKEDDPEKIK